MHFISAPEMASPALFPPQHSFSFHSFCGMLEKCILQSEKECSTKMESGTLNFIAFGTFPFFFMLQIIPHDAFILSLCGNICWSTC